ncbi:transcription elongation factor [Synechococcus phage S-CRES3]|nr:transcription elongation factor [Synechococcus phage S-CRES3]
MGRTLKDGTFKPKPSATKASERMLQPATPLPIFRKGSQVKVFLGAGWGKGRVEYSDKVRCVVYLKIGSRRVTCYDARNLKEEKTND